jgi:hypothetical protein
MVTDDEVKKALTDAVKDIPVDELRMMMKMAKMNLELSKPLMDGFLTMYHINKDMAINLMAATLVACCMEAGNKDIDTALGVLEMINKATRSSIEHLDRDVNK